MLNGADNAALPYKPGSTNSVIYSPVTSRLHPGRAGVERSAHAQSTELHGWRAGLAAAQSPAYRVVEDKTEAL